MGARIHTRKFSIHENWLTLYAGADVCCVLYATHIKSRKQKLKTSKIRFLSLSLSSSLVQMYNGLKRPIRTFNGSQCTCETVDLVCLFAQSLFFSFTPSI